MITKDKLRDAITFELEIMNIDDAEEIADSVVEKLDEDGLFDVDDLES